MEQIILVDRVNRPIGTAEKYYVHKTGLLHRAFSIFLIDEKNRILLQKRHPSKYHSGGLWANSCCGHPRSGENTPAAAIRRLSEELGIRADLHYGFNTSYYAKLSNGLIENELVDLFFGRLNRPIIMNPNEIIETRLISVESLATELISYPQDYACWLRFYFERHFSELVMEVFNLNSRSTHPLATAVFQE